MASKEQILESLKKINYPGFSRDIVSFGIVQQLEVEGNAIHVGLVLKSQDPKVSQALQSEIESVLGKDFSGAQVSVDVQVQAPGQIQGGQQRQMLLPNVKYKIAVASGKGGVGKSTVAVNLALALAKMGMKTGLLDADIYGPSIPVMFDIKEQPAFDGRKLHPIHKYGVNLMSLGFLVDQNDPVIWRGALVTRALQQLMNDVNWDGLDVIVFDMPPGTGDAQLTLSQTVALDGAIIVSTPQNVALLDAVKGVQMFRKVNVPIMGIIENMSYFSCPHCGERSDIFDHGGVRKTCESLNTELLGEIPLDTAIRVGGDKGVPIVAGDPDSAQSKAFMDAAATVKKKLEALESAK